MITIIVLLNIIRGDNDDDNYDGEDDMMIMMIGTLSN